MATKEGKKRSRLSPELPGILDVKKRGRIGGDKRNPLTGQLKKYLCELKRDNPNFTHTQISQAFMETEGFSVPKSTISDVLKDSSKWLELDDESAEASATRKRTPKYETIENALLVFYNHSKAQNVPITDKVLQSFAIQLRDANNVPKEEFKVSTGWIQKFKKRHKIALGPVHSSYPAGRIPGSNHLRTEAAKAEDGEEEKVDASGDDVNDDIIEGPVEVDGEDIVGTIVEDDIVENAEEEDATEDDHVDIELDEIKTEVNGPDSEEDDDEDIPCAQQSLESGRRIVSPLPAVEETKALKTEDV